MSCSWIRRINIFKMAILSPKKLQIQCNPYQITDGIFYRTRTRNLKIHMETQISWTARTILKKKNGAGGFRFPDFSLYYYATVIKKVRHWPPNSSIDQWNKTEITKRNPCTKWSINLWQRMQEYMTFTMLERESIQQIVLGKLDSYSFFVFLNSSFYNTIH